MWVLGTTTVMSEETGQIKFNKDHRTKLTFWTGGAEHGECSNQLLSAVEANLSAKKSPSEISR